MARRVGAVGCRGQERQGVVIGDLGCSGWVWTIGLPGSFHSEDIPSSEGIIGYPLAISVLDGIDFHFLVPISCFLHACAHRHIRFIPIFMCTSDTLSRALNYYPMKKSLAAPL